MELNNFRYALSLAHMLYDINIDDEDDAIEIGLIAYKKIGNKNTQLHKSILSVDCNTGEVQLPCNIDIIEATTYCGYEDWNYSSNIKENGDIKSSYVENYIEGRKLFNNPLYNSGKFVKYKKVGDKLYVDKGLNKISILYHQEILDEDNLPYLTDKEALAVANYISYTYKYKEYIKDRNQDTKQQAMDLKKEWLSSCLAARSPEYVSQEEMDQILNVQASWGRKKYNKSYKPIP